MRQAMAAASEKIPFTIRKAFFVSEKPVIFGNYNRVSSNEFPTGSSLITYAEPGEAGRFEQFIVMPLD